MVTKHDLHHDSIHWQANMDGEISKILPIEEELQAINGCYAKENGSSQGIKFQMVSPN